MTIGRSLPGFAAVWAKAVRTKNDGAAAKPANASPLDLRKKRRFSCIKKAPLFLLKLGRAQDESERFRQRGFVTRPDLILNNLARLARHVPAQKHGNRLVDRLLPGHWPESAKRDRSTAVPGIRPALNAMPKFESFDKRAAAAGRRRRLQTHAGHGRPSETRGDKPRKAAAGSLAGADPLTGTAVLRDAQPVNAGVYEVSVEVPGMQPLRQAQRFNVYDTNVERLMTMADPMALRMLAEHSGGRFYEADQAGDLVNQLRLFHLSQRVPPQLEYIWDSGGAHGRIARLGRLRVAVAAVLRSLVVGYR